jgi:hypothetical protein
LNDVVLHNEQRVGVPMMEGPPVTQVWYADDGCLMSLNTQGMRAMLDICSIEFESRGLYFNAAPTKSAIVRMLPWDQRIRASVKQKYKLDGTKYELQHQDLPYVSQYKHLGVVVHNGGAVMQRSAQQKRLHPVVATIIRSAASSNLTQYELLFTAIIYRTYWLPKVTYEIGLIWEEPSQQLIHMESVVLRMLFRSPNTPLVVLRSIIGLPTWQTRVDLDRLRVLMRLLSTPAQSQVRQQLCVELATYDALTTAGVEKNGWSKRLWWHRTLELLKTLDAVCDDTFRSNNSTCPVSWVAWARQHTQQYQHKVNVTPQLMLTGKLALLRIEQLRQLWEVQRCSKSLQEVQELIIGPNMAPYVVEKRTKAAHYRTLLRGGRRVLFGYRHYHVDRCVWCGCMNAFTVPHLLRDCLIWSALRQNVWQKAHTIAVEAGVMDPNENIDSENWYRLMCGAAVPTSFINLNLDTNTHFARGPASATHHLKQHLTLYQQLLTETGVLLCTITDETIKLLSTGSRNWEYTLSTKQSRVPVNHRTREMRALVATTQAQS